MANKISGYNACTLSVFLILFFSMSLCKNSSIFRKQFSVIVQTQCSFQEAQRGLHMLWALWKNIGLNIYQPWVYVSLKPTWNKHARMDNPFSRGIPRYREYRNTFETDKNRKKTAPSSWNTGHAGYNTAASYKFRCVHVSVILISEGGVWNTKLPSFLSI